MVAVNSMMVRMVVSGRHDFYGEWAYDVHPEPLK
jgi:hypothetical protein